MQLAGWVYRFAGFTIYMCVLAACLDNANVHQSNSSAASRVCTMADAAGLVASLLDRFTSRHTFDHAAVDVPVVAPAVYMASDITDDPFPAVLG